MAKTRQELQDLAENVNIIDNNTEQIDPIEVRNQYQEERESTINKLDDGVEALDVISGKYLKYSTPPNLSSMDSDGLSTIQNINDLANQSVNSHSDVELGGVSVFQNSTLKYNGSDYIPCLDVLIDAPSLVINNTNQTVDVVNTNINIQRLNPHKITISYGWSLNDARQDFETFATFGGQNIAKGLTNNNPIHIQEPKDVGGADPDGRGTNQKLPFTRVFIVTPTFLGNNSFILQMSGSQNGDLASIWDVKIQVEEYINVNNL